MTEFPKSVISLAFSLAIGFGVSANVQAQTVLNWELSDYNNDGLISDLEFEIAPSGAGLNAFGASGETGCINAADGNTCDPMLTDGNTITTDVFTTGFNFFDIGNFKPNVTTGGVVADVRDGVLTFGALNFGGKFPDVTGDQILLPPLDLTAVIVEDLTPLGQDTNGDDLYGVVVRYDTLVQPCGPITCPRAFLRLEGVMTVANATVRCAGITPLSVVTTVGGGQSAAVNGQVETEFTGRITTTAGLVSGGKNAVSICAGTTVDYNAFSIDGSTVTCSTGATSGTLNPGDRLICTNKPGGDDTDRFSVKGVAP